ncbi:MAG: translation initiation factor [Spirochaetia bacterium]|nr:translation initiation factor [Spirochaetia bacterium]
MGDAKFTIGSFVKVTQGLDIPPASASSPTKPSAPHKSEGAPVRKNLPVIEIWISKEGRAGKAVSLLKSLRMPESQAVLLLTAIKKYMACGGTFKNNEIVVQSDDRSKIKSFLLTQGFEGKICGG